VKVLGCSYSYFNGFVRGEENISVMLALKICKLTSLNIKNVVDKIHPNSKTNLSYIKPKSFPINLDKNIANLVGHVFGDGHLGHHIHYTNSNKVLIRNVIDLVNKLPVRNLTYNLQEHKGTNIRFSTLVRDILKCAQAPVGNKIISKIFIPSWVKNSKDEEIKSAFLRALFDDESCVSSKDRAIMITFSKIIPLESNLDKFIEDIMVMLDDLGIKRISKRVERYYQGKKYKTIKKSLNFYGYFNLKSFQENIDFSHPRKLLRLEKWIKNVKIFRLSKKDRLNLFIKTLNEKPLLTAKEISNIVNMHHHATLGYLNKLRNKGLVEKTIYEWPTRWVLPINLDKK